MARHAIVDTKGNVVNCVEWDGAEWLPPRNHHVIQSNVANIGDVYDFNKKIFTKPSMSISKPSTNK